VPESPVPGRSIVTRRAIVDLVRAAALGSYGVIELSDRRRVWRLLGAVGLGPRGIAVSLADGIAIELSVTVAHGLPIAEVARQLDSAVRYGIRRALERDIDRLVVHVNGLKVLPGVARQPARVVMVQPEPPRTEVVALSSLPRRRGMLRRFADGRSR
jgi:uncharacterized alkaline shock family protein YloU